LGFFAFTHSRDRPDSYHEPFRFDTVPSSPMRHARRWVAPGRSHNERPFLLGSQSAGRPGWCRAPNP